MGKSKRAIEELVARLAPQPPAPALIRKLPEGPALTPAVPATLTAAAPPSLLDRREEHRPVISPLSEERFKKQWKAIDALNEKLKPFRVLKSVEAEVRSDGSLDFDRRFFDQFDIVGASIHQSYRQSPEKLTARAVMALEHPSVDILFHPTNILVLGTDHDLPSIALLARSWTPESESGSSHQPDDGPIPDSESRFRLKRL